MYTHQYDVKQVMLLSTTLTARLPDDLFDEIERISQEEHLDKSAVARRLLEKAVREHRLEAAVDRYREGNTTLRTAATKAGMPLREFINELSHREIPLAYGPKDLEEDLQGPIE